MAHFTTSDGLSLYYSDTRNGPPVLCLAGLTRNSDDFSYLVPHLRDYRVITMDYRGRGQSDHDPDYRNYNILREAQDAIELLDHLGIERTAIIGTSRGGLIAMTLALGHVDRMTGVVLNDIGPDISADGLTRIMDYVGIAPSLPDLDSTAAALAAVSAQEFPGVPLERWREQAEFMFHELPEGGVGLRYDPALRDALLESGSTGEAPDLWLLFDHLAKLPVGVVHGENSDLLSSQTVEKMREHHPGLMSTMVPDRGHVPFLDEVEAVVLIKRLLEKTTP